MGHPKQNRLSASKYKKLLLKVSKMAYFCCLQNDFFDICLRFNDFFAKVVVLNATPSLFNYSCTT